MVKIITVSNAHFMKAQNVLRVFEPEKLILKFKDDTLLRAKGATMKAVPRDSLIQKVGANIGTRNIEKNYRKQLGYPYRAYYEWNQDFFADGVMKETFSLCYEEKGRTIEVIEVLEEQPNFIIDVEPSYIVNHPASPLNVINLSRKADLKNPYEDLMSFPLFLKLEHLLDPITVRVMEKKGSQKNQEKVKQRYQFPLLYRRLWTRFFSTLKTHNEKVTFRFRMNYRESSKEYFDNSSYTYILISVDIQDAPRLNRYEFLSRKNFSDNIKIARFRGVVHMDYQSCIFSGKADIMPLMGGSEIVNNKDISLNFVPVTEMSYLDTDNFPASAMVFGENTFDGLNNTNRKHNLQALEIYVELGNRYSLKLLDATKQHKDNNNPHELTEIAEQPVLNNFCLVYNSETNNILDFRISEPMVNTLFKNRLLGSLLCMPDCAFVSNKDHRSKPNKKYPPNKKNMPALVHRMFVDNHADKNLTLFGCEEVTDYLTPEDLSYYLSVSRKDELVDLIDEFSSGIENTVKKGSGKSDQILQRDKELAMRLSQKPMNRYYYDYTFTLAQSIDPYFIWRSDPPSIQQANDDIEQVPFLMQIALFNTLIKNAKKAGKPIVAEFLFTNRYLGSQRDYLTQNTIYSVTNYIRFYGVLKIILYVTEKDMLTYLDMDKETFNKVKETIDYKERYDR